MIAFKNWLMTQEALKKKYAIDEEKLDEYFYICGEDLEDAFKAGMKFQAGLMKKIIDKYEENEQLIKEGE